MPPFYGIENYAVRFPWTSAFSKSDVSWYSCDISGEPILTLTRADNQTHIQSQSDVTYLEGPDSVGMILANVITQASGIYSVQILIDDERRDYASTNLTAITGTFLDITAGCQSD